MIRTLVVDDEALARERITSLLQKEKDVEIAGECSDGESALACIKKLKPDLIFLDIQMPLMSGIDVIKNLKGRMPEVIFVTAYDKYAIEAFEMNAVDYLLKPFDKERFAATMSRARRRILSADDMSEKLNKLISSLSPGRKEYLTKFVIKSAGRISFINTEEINYIEAEGNYLLLHTVSGKHLYRDTISNITERLDPRSFIRIHRSFIINTGQIKEMHTHFNGEYIIILKDNTKLRSGRSYKSAVEQLIKN